jgi:hypothetical protein
MIDWNWPIEFEDGTPAWLDEDSYSRSDGSPVRLVLAAERPFGVSMAKEGRIYKKLCEGHETYLRNVEMPELRFEDGTKPGRGQFTGSGRIVLWNASGFEEYAYSWPGLKPVSPSAPRVITLNKKELAAAEAREAEQAALEESDLYGLF